MDSADIERMLTVEEIMENLHISSKTTILKLLALDSFPKVKIGKKYLVPMSAYKKWVKDVMNTEVTL